MSFPGKPSRYVVFEPEPALIKEVLGYIDDHLSAENAEIWTLDVSSFSTTINPSSKKIGLCTVTVNMNSIELLQKNTEGGGREILHIISSRVDCCKARWESLNGMRDQIVR